MPKSLIRLISALLSTACILSAHADSPQTNGDRTLAEYFRSETAAIAGQCLADIRSLDDWTSRRVEYRRQLAEMLGLWPEPPRTDLKPFITGTIDHPDFTVEKLHFQSRPGLYVTCNLYLPKHQTAPSPAILYVCGHALVKKDGVSYGNKAWGQYYGEWLARSGYVCLITDTLELGEIDGIHHGLYRLGMWDWQSRGYTPAGVETWNSIRALDYLQARPEVDPQRLGMMGRSGGGATTWYTAALDERVKVAVPTAGITDLTNHVVDGTIEGHCDCMFMVNTYRWDFAQVAALIAPRPLLFANTDKDSIFPLDGVVRVHEKVRQIYKLYRAADNLGLLITEGPHHDSQELQIPAFKWANRFLKNDSEPLKVAVFESLYQPPELRVFDPGHEPADQINSRIQSSFVPTVPPPTVPKSADDWARQTAEWIAQLKAKTFGGWPETAPPLDVQPKFAVTASGITLRAFEFTSQQNVRLRFYVAAPADNPPAVPASLHIVDQQEWEQWLSSMRVGFPEALIDEVRDSAPSAPDEKGFAALRGQLNSGRETVIIFAPRGIGPTAWNGDPKHRTQILRRFGLLGQTLDGQRVWDVRRAMQAVRTVGDNSLVLSARGRSAAIALYASLFEPPVESLRLTDLPASHREGPELLNVLKTLDLPAVVAMAAELALVRLNSIDAAAWEYPQAVAAALHWPPERLRLNKAR